ncbi:hypothetical protein ACFVVA_36860 [Kitasatospora sp. NPDC058048]|uniref:hypothetical protein n=1 Tax=Kitasatospora sp. NPDC058048 TaxID=3346313 RepID=UPI0036DCB9F4
MSTLTAPPPVTHPMPWPLEMQQTLYPPAVPGGITLCFTRRRQDGHAIETEQCPPVRTPGQAMRAMRRVTQAYGMVMAPRSQAAVRRWAADMRELHTALAELSNSHPYHRSWILRNGDVITVALVPAAAARTQRAHPTAEFTPQHGEDDPR